MNGKIVLVTGATAGIGFHIAAALATLGARVFVTGRNESRGKEAVDELRRLAGHNQIELILSDASLTRDNVALADEVARRVDRLDVLVANAGGGVVGDRRMTREGLELNLALNFIGPFTLTNRLLPLLSKSAPTRIVHVGSSAFQMAKGDPFADLNSDQRYVGIEAHARAKLLALLFVLALVRKLEGTSIVANSRESGDGLDTIHRGGDTRCSPRMALHFPDRSLVSAKSVTREGGPRPDLSGFISRSSVLGSLLRRNQRQTAAGACARSRRAGSRMDSRRDIDGARDRGVIHGASSMRVGRERFGPPFPRPHPSE